MYPVLCGWGVVSILVNKVFKTFGQCSTTPDRPIHAHLVATSSAHAGRCCVHAIRGFGTMNVSQSISATVTSLSFSFLTTEDIRRISVKQITNPVLLDDLNRPNIGGLYDPALGPSDKKDLCVRPSCCIPLVLTSAQLCNMSSILFHLPRSLWTYWIALSCLSPSIYGTNAQYLAWDVFVLS